MLSLTRACVLTWKDHSVKQCSRAGQEELTSPLYTSHERPLFTEKVSYSPGNLFQISRSCAASDLYDQYDRRIQSSAPEGDEIKNSLSFGRQPAEDAVSGDDRYYKEMDGAPPGLGGQIHSQLEIYFEERLEGHSY